MTNVEETLQARGIEFTAYEHPAVYTCEDAEKHFKDIPGVAGKNLFLKDEKGKEYFLIVLPVTQRADLKKIAGIVGHKRLTFAKPEELKEKLDLTPGSVSPFGLLNDKDHKIKAYIDKTIYDAEIVNFHPNRNTASLELTKEMFHKYLETLENEVEVVDLLGGV